MTLQYDIMYSERNASTFQRNVLPPCLGWKSGGIIFLRTRLHGATFHSMMASMFFMFVVCNCRKSNMKPDQNPFMQRVVEL